MSTIDLCGFRAGLDQPFFLIAGTCVIDSEAMALEVAGQLKELTMKLGIPFIDWVWFLFKKQMMPYEFHVLKSSWTGVSLVIVYRHKSWYMNQGENVGKEKYQQKSTCLIFQSFTEKEKRFTLIVMKGVYVALSSQLKTG